MAQQVRSPLVSPSSHPREPTQVLGALLPIQFPANVLGKAVFWATTSLVGDQMELLAAGFGITQTWLLRPLEN